MDNDADEVSDRLDELELRVEDVESGESRGEAGLTLGYAMGMTLAMILSWERSHSILWCMLHGLFSWGYVIYFAVTS
jgi:tetrahydromethanopterin S-methyltransferase subunit G